MTHFSWKFFLPPLQILVTCLYQRNHRITVAILMVGLRSCFIESESMLAHENACLACISQEKVVKRRNGMIGPLIETVAKY